MIKEIILFSSIIAFLTNGIQHLIIWNKVKKFKEISKKYIYYFFFSLVIIYGVFVGFIIPPLENEIMKTIHRLAIASCCIVGPFSFAFLIGTVYNFRKNYFILFKRLLFLYVVFFIITCFLTFLLNNDIYIKIYMFFGILVTVFMIAYLPYCIFSQNKNNIKPQILFGTVILGLFIVLGLICYFVYSYSFYIFFLIGYYVIQLCFADAIAEDYQKGYIALKNEKDTLEIKVKERTKELELSNQQIQEKERQKTNFFINFTHEIKNPLSVIKNHIDLMIKKSGETEELAVIKRNFNELIRNTDNYLDIEKLGKGLVFYYHNEISNISGTVRDKLLLYEKIIKNKGLKLNKNIENSLYAQIDPYAFDRILSNLLDNAIKFTNSGEISVLLKETDNKIFLTVTDTGIGIPEDKINTIFEPYSQISNEKRNIQGLGMGLNITKKIIDEVNGTIDVKSKLNKGTSFVISFDSYQLENFDKVISSQVSLPFYNIIDVKFLEERYDKNKNTIFIIEDNIELVSSVQKYLYESFNIYYAFNGKEALNKIKSIPEPDIIISDIMMDEMNGFEFYDKLINDEKYKDVPFIFLTAKTDFETKKKGLKKGAFDYICKPVSNEELKIKIETLLKNNEKQKELKMIELENERKNKRIKILHDAKITKREDEILDFCLEGYENKIIAEKLKISENTVKKHISMIFEKIGVKTRLELINKMKE